MTKARVNADNASADIQGVTAGTGLTGGGTSGTVTLNLDTTAVIQPTIFDAKADLLTATADNTPARLAVGNNGETLVADSSASTGLRWTGANQQQPVINSAFDVWQRGTSFAIPASYTFTADRFEAIRAGGALGMTISRQSTNDTTNLPQIRYCARIARDSGNTSTAAMYIDHSIETADSIRYAGQAITISLYARVGANYSPTSNAFKVKGVNGTGTDQAIKNYTGANLFINSTINPTTTWARYAVSGTVPTNSTEFGIEFEINPTGTAGANDYIEITGIQIDLGSVALPYRRSAATLAGELAACQRYYYLHTSGTSTYWGNGMNYSATQANGYVQFPATMRTAPSLVATSGTNYYEFVRNGAGDTFNSLTILSPNTTGSSFYNNSEISGTAGHAGIFYSANASASVAFNAEL